MHQARGCLWVTVVLLWASASFAQSSSSNQMVQVSPPPLHQVEPPPAGASAQELEQRGDELYASKFYLDAMDYYRAALKGTPTNAVLLNKVGIAELLLHRAHEAKTWCERSIKADRSYAFAYNNLGVAYYELKNYGRAIKEYNKAVELHGESASFYVNLGAAYFAKKEFDKAIDAYNHAIQLDPDVLDHSSHGGISAQLARPEDQAHYDYVMAKLYAKMGEADMSLHYLKRSMEEGYKNIEAVYKDNEFGELRKDPRFMALMANRPLGIPD